MNKGKSGRKVEDNNSNLTMKRKNLRDIRGMKMTGTTKATILKARGKNQKLRTFQEVVLEKTKWLPSKEKN